MTTTKKGYESVMEFLQDGYGKGMASVLLLCMERYLYATEYLDVSTGKADAENMWYLSTLFKCIVRDEFGIDLEIPPAC